jgi:hypothetical protein
MIFIDTRRRGSVQVTPAIQMTAAASGSNGITVADDDDIDFGTGDFFLHEMLSRTNWQPAAIVRLAFKTDGANGYSLSINGSGAGNFLVLGINGTNYISSIAPFTVLVSEQMATFGASIVRSTATAAGSVTFYLNGAPFGTSQAISVGAPVTVDNATPLYLLGTSTTRSQGTITTYISGNFAPSAAEMAYLHTTGIPESWKWGTQTYSYFSNFSVDTDGFTASFGTATGNNDGVAGRDNVLTYTATSTGVGRRINQANSTPITAGKLYSIKISARFLSTNSVMDSALICDSSGNTVFASAVISNQPRDDAWANYSFTDTALVSVTTGMRMYFGASASTSASTTSGDAVNIVDFQIREIGATLALLPNSIPTSGATAWDDSSGNTGGGTLPAAGATKVTIRK